MIPISGLVDGELAQRVGLQLVDADAVSAAAAFGTGKRSGCSEAIWSYIRISTSLRLTR